VNAVLDIRDLHVQYRGAPPVRAVDGVDLRVGSGETVALVGESGCGKSTTVRSILRLLSPTASITGGGVYLGEQELTGMKEKQLRRVRWRDVSFIPQQALNSLDPVYRVEAQIVEVLRAHGTMTRREARARTAELFRLVGIGSDRLKSYPHELSGGMRQRVVIAMALALHPKVVIADEATTALDVITQRRILTEVRAMQRELGFGMLYVSHDIGVVAQISDRIAVMYAGKIVEDGPAASVLGTPSHPYTMALKYACPDVRQRRPVVSISGYPPSLAEPPIGCRFANRCPFATTKCVAEAPPLLAVGGDWRVACHYTERAHEFREQASRVELWERDTEIGPSVKTAAI